MASNYDLNTAQRGFIFLDEFDKIGKNSLDIKEAVKQILLKFIEGDTFMIDKQTDDYSFNTRMLSKTFAGAFEELFDSSKPIVFCTSTEAASFDPSKITTAEYFGKELVTRIEHILEYKPLTKEMQRRVLLESKLSKLLQKKKRYEEEFGVELVILEEYIEAVLEKLRAQDKSMRDLNNIVLKTLLAAEFELLDNEGKIQRLILTRDTVSDPEKIKIE